MVRTIFIILTVVFAALVLTACQPSRVLNTVVPSSSYTVERSVIYGENNRQTMDIYMPEESPLNDKVVVFVYGGAWDQGSKEQFEFVGQAFARLGYVTVIPNYRLFPDVQFPKFIEDIALAINQLPAQLAQRLEMPCPSADNIILAGHSAGAHTAALLVADTGYFKRFVAHELKVHALIGMSGPYDLPLDHDRVKEKFATVEGDEANPVALAHAHMPPTLLLHGESDTIAESLHSTKFESRLSGLGVEVQSHIYAKRRHADLLASLASPLRFWSSAYEDIQAFLEAYELDNNCYSKQPAAKKVP